MRIIQECLNISDQLPTILTWSVFTFLLSVFLNFCMGEKNIFEGWLNFWAKWWLVKNNPDLLNEAKQKTDETIYIQTKGEYETVREWVFSQVKWFWFKPLGGCVICMNVWICFAFFWTQESLIGVLAMILLSNFFVRVSQEKLL